MKYALAAFVVALVAWLPLQSTAAQQAVVNFLLPPRWEGMRKAFFADAPVVFDPGVQVISPANYLSCQGRTIKGLLIAVLLTLSAAARASDVDYGLMARKVANDVYPFVGRTEDFTVVNTPQHPDHFLGNQAFANAPIAALPECRQGIAMDGNAFAENLFRLTGERVKGGRSGRA